MGILQSICKSSSNLNAELISRPKSPLLKNGYYVNTSVQLILLTLIYCPFSFLILLSVLFHMFEHPPLGSDFLSF